MLDDNDILMYSIHNEGKSLVAERIIRALKVKIHIQMTGNDSKPYLGYMNKLVDECNKSYHRSTGKNPLHLDYSTLPQEIESNLKVPKSKVYDRVSLTKYKSIFSKGYTGKSSKLIFVIGSMFKTHVWRCKIENFNGGTIIGKIHEK